MSKKNQSYKRNMYKPVKYTNTDPYCKYDVTKKLQQVNISYGFVPYFDPKFAKLEHSE